MFFFVVVQKEDTASAKPVFNFNREPDPVEWHLTRNKDEYNILTVSGTHRALWLLCVCVEGGGEGGGFFQ